MAEPRHACDFAKQYASGAANLCCRQHSEQPPDWQTVYIASTRRCGDRNVTGWTRFGAGQGVRRVRWISERLLRNRSMIAGTVAVFAILMIALALASGIFIQRFDHIATSQAHEKSMQALRALQTDLDQLALSTREHAEWDEA